MGAREMIEKAKETLKWLEEKEQARKELEAEIRERREARLREWIGKGRDDESKK